MLDISMTSGFARDVARAMVEWEPGILAYHPERQSAYRKVAAQKIARWIRGGGGTTMDDARTLAVSILTQARGDWEREHGEAPELDIPQIDQETRDIIEAARRGRL